MKKVSISVVICTRNRPEHLRKCVASLLKQSYLPTEIVIVDDGPEENANVYAVFKNFKLNRGLSNTSNKVDIIVIKNKEYSGIVTSRNTGIKVSSGDVVAFLDDDGFAHRGWLKNLAKNYSHKTISGVGGPVVELGREIETPTKPVKRLAYIEDGKIYTNYRIKKIEDTKYLPRSVVPFFQGGNMSFRKDVLISVKGGDANLTGNFYREETDLCFKVARKGKLLFEPTAITYHDTAMNGGCRDIINFNLERFLYYMFRNTTYFFFKNFNFKQAFNFTVKAVYKQILLLRKHKTGITRDYLKILNVKKSIKAVIAGTLDGVCTWFKNRKTELELICSQPAKLGCFKLVLIGGSFKLVELERKTHIIKKLFGL